MEGISKNIKNNILFLVYKGQDDVNNQIFYGKLLYAG